jgi:hypothetical protein
MSRLHEVLRDYINWCIGITFALAALLLTRTEIATLYQTEPIRAVLVTILLAETLAWFFSYIYAVRHELDLLDSAFEWDKSKNYFGFILPTGVGLALLFGGLIAFSTNILVYSALVLMLSVFDLYGQSVVIRNIGLHLFDKQFHGKGKDKEEQILCSYYLGKPLLLRLSVILSIFCAVLVLVITARFENYPRRAFEYAAHIIIIFTILVGEVVLYRWRKDRDLKLPASATKSAGA